MVGGAIAVAPWLKARTTAPGRPLAGRRATPHDARIAVIGAGLAGLTAAYQLSQQGLHVRVYEARDRIGGRCWTARGFADGQTAERGGEFIDTRHVHLIQLAKEFDLHLTDLWKGYSGVWPIYVDGTVYRGKDMRAQLDPIIQAVTRAARHIGAKLPHQQASDVAYSYKTATPGAIAMDRHWPCPKPLLRKTLGWLDQAVPGTREHFNGNDWSDWWTGDAWTLGSYAAFLPGQMTRFWKGTGQTEGGVYFAGEHTSTYSKGFLNGGVESGDRVAIALMRRLGITPPRHLTKLPYSQIN